MSDTRLDLGSAPPETVLPEVPASWLAALAEAGEHERAGDVAAARVAAAAEARRHPTHLAAWATLAELSDGDVEAYAYARVGYHRGLDALRAAGWRGTGYVRWRHETNRGFLRSLAALAAAAERIGEEPEADRCRLFLRQLDPDAR